MTQCNLCVRLQNISIFFIILLVREKRGETYNILFTDVQQGFAMRSLSQNVLVYILIYLSIYVEVIMFEIIYLF